MAGLTFAPVKKKTLKVNGHAFEVRVTDLEIIDMIVQYEAAMRGLAKKLDPGEGAGDGGHGMEDARGVLDSYNSVIEGIDRMLGEGALEKIMGTTALPIAKIIEVFEGVSSEITKIYEADIKGRYE